MVRSWKCYMTAVSTWNIKNNYRCFTLLYKDLRHGTLFQGCLSGEQLCPSIHISGELRIPMLWVVNSWWHIWRYMVKISCGEQYLILASSYQISFSHSCNYWSTTGGVILSKNLLNFLLLVCEAIWSGV